MRFGPNGSPHTEQTTAEASKFAIALRFESAAGYDASSFRFAGSTSFPLSISIKPQMEADGRYFSMRTRNSSRTSSFTSASVSTVRRTSARRISR